MTSSGSMDGKEPIPDEFSSLEEIQEFWDRHSSADYEDEMETVEMELSDSLKAKIESRKLFRLLGLSAQQVAMIKALAEEQHVGIKDLIARWVLEHLHKPSAA